MKTKEEFIKSLSKVKLIIGNGFDLHCHMKTSYKDYFLYDKDKNDYFGSWIDEFLPKLDNYVSFNTGNFKDFWLPFKSFDKANIWDLFFYINSDIKYGSTKEWAWCDIEKLIYSWLKDRNKTQFDSGKSHWENVYSIINNHVKSENERESLMAAFVFKKHNEHRFENIEDFYLFLLEQLKLFEENFGKYIYQLHFKGAFGGFPAYEKTSFNSYAKFTIDDLCDIDKLVSIDSFNYDNIRLENIFDKIYNINGDWYNPIFGIDSNAFPANDIRYIFSKTNRRMELDMINDEERKNVPFDNVVIYGHSLDESDYSYFFSIFDKLKITDLTNDSKVVFAFSIYDSKLEQKIKNDYRISIAKLFYDYSIYLGKDKQPNRLLDVLTSQGKILMYEINEINVEFY